MTKRLCEVFRENLRARMEELDLTQADVADAMKVSRGFISQLLNGYRKPGLEVIEAVAKALKISPLALLQENLLTHSVSNR